jgi:hypothetical protein
LFFASCTAMRRLWLLFFALCSRSSTTNTITVIVPVGSSKKLTDTLSAVVVVVVASLDLARSFTPGQDRSHLVRSFAPGEMMQDRLASCIGTGNSMSFCLYIFSSMSFRLAQDAALCDFISPRILYMNPVPEDLWVMEAF